MRPEDCRRKLWEMHHAEIVSSDVIGSSYSSVFDAGLTSVVDGTQVKVVAWYDNEWGYSTRLVELAQRVLGRCRSRPRRVVRRSARQAVRRRSVPAPRASARAIPPSVTATSTANRVPIADPSVTRASASYE
jgi:Glyceraldehyde 3-phosphate dehydrogenase, C-terminal domain